MLKEVAISHDFGRQRTFCCMQWCMGSSKGESKYTRRTLVSFPGSQEDKVANFIPRFVAVWNYKPLCKIP